MRLGVSELVGPGGQTGRLLLLELRLCQLEILVQTVEVVSGDWHGILDLLPEVVGVGGLGSRQSLTSGRRALVIGHICSPKEILDLLCPVLVR